MSLSDQLVKVLREKQPRRVMCFLEVQVAGKWVWELQPVSQAVADSSQPAPSPQKPSSLPTPVQGATGTVAQGPRRSKPPQSPRPLPPMTQGRDPAKHLITFGKKWKGMTLAQIEVESGLDEMFSHIEWVMRLQADGEEVSTSLEVSKEMMEAYLLDREYVPAPKHKAPRRQA